MKDEEKFRLEKLTRDRETLDKKVNRWKQIQPASYGRLPTLMWEYLIIMDEMYVDGYFLGVVFLCSAVTELLLSDQLVLNTQLTSDEVESFNLVQMATLAHRLGIINEEEKSKIDKLRKLRNPLIHANIGKINTMAKKRYGDYYQGMEAIFYISSFIDDGGISEDAFNYLCFIRDLSVRLYGSN